MDTSEIIIWTAVVFAYAVTVGPLVARFIQLHREGNNKTKNEETKPFEELDTITIALSESDRRVLDHLAEDRRLSTEGVAVEALRLGFEAMDETVTIRLSPRDAERIAEILDDPPAPSARFLEAKQRHQAIKNRGYRGHDSED